MAKQLNVNLNVSADTGQARQALQQLQQQLTQLTMNPSNITIGGQLKKDAIEATQAIAGLQSALKKSTNLETGNLDLTKFKYQMKQSGMELKDYQSALNKMGPAGQQAFAQLARSISQAEVPLKRSNSLLKSFWTTMQNTMRWQLSSSVLHGFMGAISTAYNYAKDLNQSLNNIQIVTQASNEQMAQFAESANKAARNLSTTTTKYTDAALIYYQQGLGDKEVIERTNATIKMANVTGQSAEKVSDQMTAIWNNFDNGSKSLEYYADVITALGAATASSSEEISKGLEKFASIADTVGLSYENATAALATITATTRQSADTVGTGLRTLFSRFQSLTLGETLEDNVDLTKYSKALKTIGVDVIDANGNLRKMDNILEDMGARWSQLTEAQKMATAQTVGGVRQYTTLMALMENFDFFKQNQQVALGSEGTLQKQQEIYEKSWKAASKQLQASAESIYADLLDDKFFIKLTQGFSKFLDLIHHTIEGLGGLKGILLTIGTVMTTVFAQKTAQRLQGIVYDLKMLTPSGRKQINDLRKEGNDMLIQAAGSQGGVIGDSLSSAYKAQGELSNVYLSNAVSMSEYQKEIANSLLQQQAALVKNVELSAQEVQKQQELVAISKTDVRRILNSANKDYNNNARTINTFEKAASTVGKMEAQFNKGIEIPIRNKADIEAFSAQLDKLQISGNMLQSTYGTEVRNAFEQLQIALKGSDPQAVTNAITNLTERMNETVPSIEGFRKHILNLAKDAFGEGTPKFEAFTRALDELAIKSEEAGAKVVKLGTDTATAGEQANRSAEAMKKVGASVQSAFSTFVSITGVISSIAMGLNTLKSLWDTWQDPDISFGEKLLQTAIQTGMAVMMLKSAFDAITKSTALVNFGNTIIAGMEGMGGAAGKLAGMLNGLKGAGASAAAALMGVVAAVAAVIVVLAVLGVQIGKAIVTPKEHLKNLAEQTEQAKQSAEKAKQAYDNLLDMKQSHNNLLEELNKLTSGTLEFQAALIKANTAARELIYKYNLSPDQYTRDANGAIQIDQKAYDSIEGQQLKEMQDEENRYITAQALEAFMISKNDYQNLLQTDGGDYEILQSTVKDAIANGATEQFNNSNNIYTKIAEQQGYINGEDVAKAFVDGTLQKNMLIESGAAGKMQFALSTIMSDKKNSPISGAEQLLIDTLSTDVDFLNEIDQTGFNYEKEGWFSKTKKNLEQRYRETFSSTELEQLQASDEYKELSGKEQKKYLANAIKLAEQQTALENKLNEKKKILNNDIFKEYDNYNEMSGKEILALRTKFLDRQTEGKIQEDILQLEESMSNDLYRQYSQTSFNTMSNMQTYNQNINKESLQDLILQTTLGDQQKFNSYIDEASTYFGQATSDFIANRYFKNNGNAKEGTNNWAVNKDFVNKLKNFNLSQGGISALASLKSGRSSFGEWDELSDNFENSSIYKFATAIRKDVGEKGLLEELYNSKDFQDSLEDIQKEFQKTGKISAKSIMDAAKSSATLDKWLKASGVGAQGLADILQSMGPGNIEGISEALLRAFGAASQLESSLAKTYDHIDSFEAERSIQDVGKFYKGLSDTVKDSFESGFIMDKPIQQAIEEMFGANKKNEYLQAAYEATGDDNLTPAQISNAMNTAMADEFALMQSIQSRGNLSGVAEYALKQAGAGSDLSKILSYNSATQQVTTTDWNELGDLQSVVGDQEQFIKTLMKEGNISENLARDFANEYGSTNGFLQKQWRTTNVNKGLEEFQNYAAENKAPIMGEDLRAFYDQYGDILGSMSSEELKKSFDIFKDFDMSNFKDGIKDSNSLVKLFKQNADKLGSSVVDLGDDFDFATDNLKALKKSFKDNNDNQDFVDDYFKKNTKITTLDAGAENFNDPGAGKQLVSADIDSAVNSLKALSATAEEAYSILDEMVEAGDLSGFTASVMGADGELKELNSNSKEFKEFCEGNGLEEGAAAFDTYKQHVAETEQQIATAKKQAEIFAEEMVNALVNNEQNVKIKIDDDGSVNEIQGKIKNLPKRSPVTISDGGSIAKIKRDIENLHPTITVRVVKTPLASGGIIAGGNTPTWNRNANNPTRDASGYNNAKGFAGGKHVAGEFEGIAETGELGPELWIRDGKPYLTGIHGRTKIYIKPNDQIFTAAQTKEILRNNPSLQDIPGFSVGYGGLTWGKASNKTAGKATGSGAKEENARTSDYSPERYHLITRQLKDLQREYEELNAIKENTYGEAKLQAIDAEIDATNRLIEGQKTLVKEAKDYLDLDTKRLKEMLEEGEFQVDQNGNLLNFEELQEKYRKAAEENDDDTHSKDVWKALEQYEETLDKFYDAQGELRDLVYREMEQRLEKITTKVDLKIDFDEKELKLLDHYINKIDDDIYKTAQVLALTETRLSVINKKLKDTQVGIQDIFSELSDKNGNKITQSNGSDYTLDAWLRLTDEQRKSLNINDKFGEQLEEYGDNLLTYVEELEEFKKKGAEEVGEAFSELNENVKSSIDLFSFYNSLLEDLKNIVELQGITMSDSLKKVLKTVDDSMMKNIENNILVEQKHFNSLVQQTKILQEKITNTTDDSLRKAYEEQLKALEEESRTCAQNLTSIWQQGLELVKDKFDRNLEDSVTSFEKSLTGIYETMDEFSQAWDDYKKLDDFYVKDYEKYYQMAKMSRAWTKDIEDAFKAGNRHTKGMQRVLDDLNAAREEGVELTEYDLDVFSKRYEYEKALMELEDARNDKNEVRLQRDANGNWGYVYVSSEDDSSLIEKQQAVEDKLHDLQSAEVSRVQQLQEDIKSIMTNAGRTLSEMYASGQSDEAIRDYLDRTKTLLTTYHDSLQKALSDAGMTVEEAKLRYGEEGFEIVDTLGETLLNQVSNGELTIEKFLQQLLDLNGDMQQVTQEYQNGIDAINKFFEESGEDLATVITGIASWVDDTSNTNLLDTQDQIENAQNTFEEILAAASDFERKFMEIYQPIIDSNEDLLKKVLAALATLNGEDWSGSISAIDKISSGKTGMYTGTWSGPDTEENGRLAFLHQKELVLNKDDTENFLVSLDKMLNISMVLKDLEAQALAFEYGFANISSPSIGNLQNETLEQQVHIEASFPNAVNHNEIEMAFDNLVNKASQYANRKNMSSMTFQDAYTSIF